MFPSKLALANMLTRPSGIRGVLIQGVAGGWFDPTGSSRGLSNTNDLQWLLTNRALADVCLVSYGTATRERYADSWTPSGELGQLRKVLGLPLSVPSLVVSNNPQRSKLAQAQFENVTTTNALRDLLQINGWDHAVCEGGPALLNDLASRNWLSEFALTTSDKFADGAGVFPALESWFSSAKSRFMLLEGDFQYELLTRNHGENASQS